jgi:predicted amidohydrolase
VKVIVGVAQARPAVLDLERAVDKACFWIGEAAKRGVRLLAFPEAWIPCYPLWCDGGSFGRWGNAAAKRLHARLLEGCLVVPSAHTARLCDAAREAGVAVVIGANEREPHGGSIYNSLVFIDAAGHVVATRRKLVPTHGERLVWSAGDAAHLDAFALAGARVGGLICWEHWMPLARHVLHAAGEEVHVAAWPHGREHHQLASRHYAFEGRCFVLAAAMVLARSDLPPDPELAAELGDAPDELLPGGSAILGPDGGYLVEPVFDREELLVAEIDLGRTREEKLTLDVGGHYARPELFDLRVRRERPTPFRDHDALEGPPMKRTL